MKRLFLSIVILVILGVATGCALTEANLNVAYDDMKAVRGPLSTIVPLRASVAEFRHSRPETDRIGYKRNGYGMKMAPIRTQKPVPEIIRQAFGSELTKMVIS